MLVQAAHQGLPHRGASGGSRRRLQASRPPLARSVPAHMLLLHISRRLRTIVTCELTMVSCRDACALQDVVLSRRSRKAHSIFAAGNIAGDARQCRVRCSSACPAARRHHGHLCPLLARTVWRPARLPRTSAPYKLALRCPCATTAPPGRILDAEMSRDVYCDRVVHMIPAWPMRHMR